MNQLLLIINQTLKIKITLYKSFFLNFFNYQKKNEVANKIALCYLGDKKHGNHTNFEQQKILVDILRLRGYVVDVFQNGDLVYSKKNYYKYIFGFGESWRILCKKNSDAIKILYCTEAPPFFSFINEYKAIVRFKKLWIKSNNTKILCRTYRFYRDEDYCNANYIIQMGELNTKILKDINIINPTNLFTIGSYGLGIQKSRIKNKKTNTFIWFGSSGVVHKGLDLVLKYFLDNPELELIVAGCKKQDVKSWIISTKNITFVGIVDVESLVFEEIMNKSSFCILPSASEGISTAIITCMYQGLIPIISIETNICSPEIIWIEPTIDSLENGINIALNIKESEYLVKSELIRNFAIRNYNKKKYSDTIKQSINAIGI